MEFPPSSLRNGLLAAQQRGHLGYLGYLSTSLTVSAPGADEHTARARPARPAALPGPPVSRPFVTYTAAAAAVLPDPRTERRRRLAEPDLEFRAICTRRRLPASSTPQLERAWDAWQAERYQRGEDRVRDVIRNFNADGFDLLYPKYKGGHPPKFTLGQRREIKKVAKSK